MSRKPTRPRDLALGDIDDAVDYYLREGGADAAFGFIDALNAAYRSIVEYPGAGAPRYGQELAIPGLRSRLLRRYPYLVFYIERSDYIDIWRVLHAHRDIPAGMREPEN